MSDLIPRRSSRPPAVEMMRNLGFEPDPWQVRVLESDHPQMLLNCCRQSGKSTVVAFRALAEAVWNRDTQVIVVSASERQSRLLLDKVVGFHRHFSKRIQARKRGGTLLFANGSCVVSLPCREDTTRGYSGIHLLIIDEAARVPDRVYCAFRPMLAMSHGRLICLSTPCGRRGFFYKEWATGGDDWERIEVTAAEVPRISAEFLRRELRSLGEVAFRQEYCCSFEAREGLVYPDFARCVVAGPAPAGGRRVGGIDFGFRNPFAAVWGALDRDGVLWLFGEHYAREQPLDYHARRLPADVMWYCDPSGAQQRCDLIRRGLKVRKGRNALDPGIMAVTARLRNGALRVVAGTCPNLLWEASLYHWETEKGERGSETPVDTHNHALDALRYLVSRLDDRGDGQGRTSRLVPPPDSGAPATPLDPQEQRQRELAELKEQRERAWRAWPDREDF